MMYVRYPLSLWNVDDLLNKRGIDISHETVRFWWNRFGPMIAAEISKKKDQPDARLFEWERLIPFSPVAPHVDAAQNLALVA